MKTRGFAFWAAGAALALGGAYASAATVDCPNQPSSSGPDYVTLTFSAPVTASCYDFGTDSNNSANYTVDTSGAPVVLDNGVLELPTGTSEIANAISGAVNGSTGGDITFLIGSSGPLWLAFKTGGGQNDPYWFAFQLGNVSIGTVVNWQLFGDALTPLNGLSGARVFGGDFVVPLPAAVWLFGSGLLGLLGIARRRRVEVAA